MPHFQFCTNQQQLVIFIHVMVSARVCFGGKERLHFIPDKTKVNAKLYVEILLPELVQECRSVLPSGFIFQQEGASAHMAKLAQDWIATNCSAFIGKDEWPPNSPNLNLWTTMSGRYAWTLQIISTQAGEHRWAQESSAGIDQQSHIELPKKTSGLCESWWSTLRTYTKMNYQSDFGICNNSQCFLTMNLQVAVDYSVAVQN